MPLEERGFATLMFTDIVGYTALSQRDERLALDLMEEHAQLLRELFRHYGGREVKALGDGFLVEFPSTLQAVECAVEIQQAERNTKLPPQMYLQVRIGRHVGDVVRREGDVFGDAVNIASRLQALAEPGGICLSGQVYAQIGNKLGLKHVSLGRKRLKNVRVAVEVYRIVVGEEVRRPPARTGEKWRIAVLPLANSVPIPLTNSSPRG